VKSSKRNIRNIAAFLIFVVSLTILLPSCAGTTSGTGTTTQPAALGLSPNTAVSIGTPVKGIIECGTGYTSHELYDVKVTVLEVARGSKAMALLSPSASPSSANLEYVAARIKFEYSARGAPGDCCHELKAAQFIAFSLSGKEYKATATLPPTPELKGKICAGNFFDGWVLFEIAKDDSKPVTMFDAGVGGLEGVEHGGNIWLRLY
jgi:hypothetical protein